MNGGKRRRELVMNWDYHGERVILLMRSNHLHKVHLCARRSEYSREEPNALTRQRELARSTIELQRSKLLKLNFAWREKFPFDAGSTAGKFPYRARVKTHLHFTRRS
jgi:hypothetical protein